MNNELIGERGTIDVFFKKAIRKLDLGEMSCKPQRVTGGYLHQMYKLETSTGVYAVKVLNEGIMKRPEAIGNFQRAERLEDILEGHGLPVVTPLKIYERKMQECEGKYFYVFPWIEGKAVGWHDIKPVHCEKVGRMLGKIHKIECHKEPCKVELLSFEWEEYIHKAQKINVEIADELSKYKEILMKAEEAFNEAICALPPVTCISNPDLDSKNVLWHDDIPRIIDLECLEYGNPYYEMFQLALSWSGSVICHFDETCLKSFISSYQKASGLHEANWEKLYGLGFMWLDWLHYNVRRALGIECQNEEEREMGSSEVHHSLARIVYHYQMKEELLSMLNKLDV